jgi:hypothetical protein
VSVAALNDAIDRELSLRLAGRGFSQARPRTWWRTDKEPIQEVVTFQARKGAAYAGVWGWAISFCPLLRGKSLKWKKTPSSVELDLMIDAVNDDGKHTFVIDAPVLGYRELNSRHVAEVVARVSEQALSDFDRVRTLADVEAMFENRSKREYFGLGPKNFVQTDLAWSLAKRATGDRAGADALYKNFVNDFHLRGDEAILAKANLAAEIVAEAVQ